MGKTHGVEQKRQHRGKHNQHHGDHALTEIQQHSQLRGTNQKHGCNSRENKHPERTFQRAVMLQRITAENAVKRIEESCTQAKQNARGRNGQFAGKNSADQRAAQQCQYQCRYFLFCYRFLPENCRHDHHKRRRRIEENRCHGQRTDLLAGEIAQCEQHHTDNAAAKKVLQMLFFYLEHGSVLHCKNRR